MAGVAADTVGLWMQVNERVMRELTELSTNAAQQSARLMTDIQQADWKAIVAEDTAWKKKKGYL